MVDPGDRYRWLLPDVESIEVRQGQYADVVIDAGQDRVWRFPRYEEARNSQPLWVERVRAARNLGLPAPEILGGDLDAPLGKSHVVLRYVRGVGLTDPAVADLPVEARQRLAEGLGELLRLLRNVDPTSWPAVGRQSWHGRWAEFRQHVLDIVLPLLTSAGADRARAEVEWAVQAAECAPRPDAFVHGDLGGANVLLEPSSGALTGVLDWDSAGFGDPAIDLAALSVSLPAPVFDMVMTRSPGLKTELERARAYARTFALQEAVFGLFNGEERAVQAGLASYPRM